VSAEEYTQHLFFGRSVFTQTHRVQSDSCSDHFPEKSAARQSHYSLLNQNYKEVEVMRLITIDFGEDDGNFYIDGRQVTREEYFRHLKDDENRLNDNE
jgi:hypothetical protein